MDKSHPRFSHLLAHIEEKAFSYKVTSIPTLEGEFLWDQIRKNHYCNTIEIGCALGISSLYICDALSTSQQWSHTIIDPYQSTDWQSIGMQNLKNAGYIDHVRLIESLSEIALPRLLEEHNTFDFGFIDGWHTFDHTLVDFFYLNRIIRVGGMIVFDDVRYPSISRVVRYVSKYPNYEIVNADYGVTLGKKYKLMTYIIKIAHLVSKCFPRKLHSLFFSDVILSLHPINAVLLQRPRWAAFRKIADDTRDYRWYENF